MYLSAISSIRSLSERAKARASRSASTPVAIATAGDTLRQPGHGAGNLPLVGADPLTVSRRARLDQRGAGVLEEAVGRERRRVQVGDGLVAGPDQQGRKPRGSRAGGFERLREASGHLHR